MNLKWLKSISFAGCESIWWFFEIILAAISALIYFLMPSFAALTASLGFFAFTNALTIASGLLLVKQQHEMVLEFFGKYVGRLYGPGLYILFPWFGLVVVRNIVYKGEIMLSLYTEDEQGRYLDNKVDFKDASAKVITTAYIKILDAVQATYEIQKVLRGVREKLDGALRSYLGGMDIQEANQHRIALDKTIILHGIDIKLKKGESDDGRVARYTAERQKLQGTKSILEEEIAKWGVELQSLAVSDIVIDAKDEEMRRRVLQAESEAGAIMKIAKAQAEQLKLIQEAGKLDPAASAQHIQMLHLYDQLPKTGANVILGSGNLANFASAGAAFGAGFKPEKNRGANEENEEGEES